MSVSSACGIDVKVNFPVRCVRSFLSNLNTCGETLKKPCRLNPISARFSLSCLFTSYRSDSQGLLGADLGSLGFCGCEQVSTSLPLLENIKCLNLLNI